MYILLVVFNLQPGNPPMRFMLSSGAIQRWMLGEIPALSAEGVFDYSGHGGLRVAVLPDLPRAGGPAVREKSVYALAGALLLAVWAAAPLAGTGATFVTVEWLCPLCALIRVGLTLAGVLL